jgi:hypothetical protein
MRHIYLRTAVLIGIAVALALPVGASGFQGGAQRLPGWHVSAQAYPTHLTPGVGIGGKDFLHLEVSDVGAAPSQGTVTVTDTLPAGITYTGAPTRIFGYEESGPEPWECHGAQIVTCTNTKGIEGQQPRAIDLELAVAANLLGSYVNAVTVSGGGALGAASATTNLEVSNAPTAPGFSNFEVWMTNADGTPSVQAGSHPYELTVAYKLNAVRNAGSGDESEPVGGSSGETESIKVNLPPGIVGNPQAVPECPQREFDAQQRCDTDTQIGVDVATLGSYGTVVVPVYNLVPPPGHPALFGLNLVAVKTYLTASVRSGSDYGITETGGPLAQREIISNETIIWGVPSDPSHTLERCHTELGEGAIVQCDQPSDAPEVPFLTLPTSCQGSPEASISASLWSSDVLGESAFSAVSSFLNEARGATSIGGCEYLSAAPSVTVAPETTAADSPTGLAVDVKVPQSGLTELGGLAAADLRTTKVVLPEGIVINPGQAAGLAACQPAEDGIGTEGPPSCPNASKVGTVSVTTPLLADRLEGNIYVLPSNPPNLKLLLAPEGAGVHVKLVAEVHLDEATGRLTTTVANTPEMPFTDFKLNFSGGAQAALATPTECGVYSTAWEFMPWSSPFTSNIFPPDPQFAISQGAGGGGCPGSPLSFSPSLVAGATTDHAGAFTGFSMLLERGDGQQRIEKLQFKLPPGLAGMISAVPLCSEPQAAQGMCPSASQVGHSTVASGPGPYPLVIPQPGEPESPIYLTGPYKGAPFGLSIVTHVLAGPFDLGTIVTRAKIEVDPRTAQITVTTDPLPQVIDGVPTDLRLVNAVIDRAGFMLNPTNCEPSSFSGTAWGAPAPGVSEPGETAGISSHFDVGSCKELQFKPTVSVSTKGQASKANGAGLSFKISYPKGAQGNESWFNEAKFDIPRQLPARLSTLQQACLAATFETNRGACPKASIIGHAVVHTPVLPDPLEGPVYFVSYGSAKFPDAVLDLTGDNVHIELHGETFISKTSVTSATFRNTPDVPFESIEVSVPTGPFSEFGANLPATDRYSFCGQKLVMPTLFKAQNGLEIHQSTPISIAGCPKKQAKKHKAHTGQHNKHKAKRQAGKPKNKH